MDTSKHLVYLDYEWATVLNRVCLRLLGVWPDGVQNQKRDIYVIFLLIMVICSTIVPTMHSLIRIWDDFLSMADNLQYMVPFLMSIMKFYILWRNQNNLTSILEMIREDWLKPKSENERNVMIRRAYIARIITMCGYMIMLLSFIFGIFLPYFGISFRYVTNTTDPGKLMPIQSYYIYDINKSPFYEITYLLQSISAMVLAIIFSSTDNFLGMLVLHISGQFENLIAHILCLDENGFENALSYNVEDHKRLIRSIKIIDDAFNMMLLGVLILFGTLFAIYGFFIVRVSRHGNDITYSRIIFIITAFVNLSAHTCFYCIAGEILVIQGEKFYEAVWELEWYKLSPRQAKNMIIIMIRAKKPLHITAGRLFPMTMSTFCSLLKTSGSYISVLMAQSE